MILLTKTPGKLLPVNSVSNNTGTGKTLTTESFDPFGEIYYYNSTSTVATNGNIGDGTLLTQYTTNLIDLRYSFNTGKTLTARTDVYLVCTPQADGTAKLASTPISQSLPSTEDGKIYIRFAMAYDTYRVMLCAHKPIYYFKDGAIRLWTNRDILSMNMDGLPYRLHFNGEQSLSVNWVSTSSGHSYTISSNIFTESLATILATHPYDSQSVFDELGNFRPLEFVLIDQDTSHRYFHVMKERKFVYSTGGTELYVEFSSDINHDTTYIEGYIRITANSMTGLFNHVEI